MQAEVVPSKYHYHQIRMKGWRGVEHAGVKETQRRGLAACISDPSSVSVSPSCSHLHGSALHHSDTNKGKGGEAGHRGTTIHQPETRHMMGKTRQSGKRINKRPERNGLTWSSYIGTIVDTTDLGLDCFKCILWAKIEKII